MKDQYIHKTKERMLETCCEQKNGCWLWTGYRCEPKKIYGLTSCNLDGKKKKILAHRLSYRLWKGEIPEGLFVLHSCDTPLCINPGHLHLGTSLDNMNEMKQRGRGRKVMGEKNHKSKLKEHEVLEIRKLYSVGLTQRNLAKKYGVAWSTIHYILIRKTWKDI